MQTFSDLKPETTFPKASLLLRIVRVQILFLHLIPHFFPSRFQYSLREDMVICFILLVRRVQKSVLKTEPPSPYC